MIRSIKNGYVSTGRSTFARISGFPFTSIRDTFDPKRDALTKDELNEVAAFLQERDDDYLLTLAKMEGEIRYWRLKDLRFRTSRVLWCCFGFLIGVAINLTVDLLAKIF